MRNWMVFLLGLSVPFSAVAAESETANTLTYVERMGLYADWATIILLIVVAAAVVRWWRKN